MTRNEKGFTLIEIIAVLVILGVLAAIAIPKYLNVQSDARTKAAYSAVAEAKSRLSLGYGKALLAKNGTNPSISDVMANGNVSASYGDFNVTVTAGTNQANITVDQVQGTAITAVTNTWTLPQ